jgi:hypothetical protein
MAKIYKIEPRDSVRIFNDDVVIYWRREGTTCEAFPRSIKINGEWEPYDEFNEDHLNRFKEIESKTKLAEVIPIR